MRFISKIRVLAFQDAFLLLESGRTFGEWGDFWRVGGLLESVGTFGECGDSWRVGGLLESGGTFGEWGDFWRVGGLLESGGTPGEWGDFWRVGGLLESYLGFETCFFFEIDIQVELLILKLNRYNHNLKK